MRLQTRLIVAFLAVALIPTGVILSFTWFTVEARFQDEFRERLDSVGSGIQHELQRMGEQIRLRVRSLAESEQIESVLVDMYRGTLDKRALISKTVSWMQAWDLDVLTVMDGSGLVLSSGHLPARYGNKDEELLALVRKRPEQVTIQQSQIGRSGNIFKVLTIEVGAIRTYKQENRQAEVLVVGGRLLDENYLGQLQRLSGAQIQIVDEDNRIQVGADVAFGGDRSIWKPQSGVTYRQLPLPTGEGTTSAFIVAGVSETKLKSALWRILVVAISAAIGGVLISWLLGVFISRKILKPVNALVLGARSVASGNLDHRIPEISGAEIGELVHTFNGMIDDLLAYQRRLVRAERVAAWQEIARRIAHEIKNPLSPIQMSIETLQKTYANGHPAFREIFEESTKAVLEEVARLKRIVSEFSDFARMPKPNLEIQDLNQVVAHTVSLYGGENPTKPDVATSGNASAAKLNYTPDAAPLYVAVDREQVGRLLCNLLSNSFYAIDLEGQVEVCTGRRNAFAFLKVVDNGSGMDAEVLQKVFTPYYTTRKDGTGLGLAIVQRIVEEHGATIEIESIKERGTSVTVFFPVAQAADRDTASSR